MNFRQNVFMSLRKINMPQPQRDRPQPKPTPERPPQPNPDRDRSRPDKIIDKPSPNHVEPDKPWPR